MEGNMLRNKVKVGFTIMSPEFVFISSKSFSCELKTPVAKNHHGKLVT